MIRFLDRMTKDLSNGVRTETIRGRINVLFTNRGKVKVISGHADYPYVKEDLFWTEVRCIFITQSQYTINQIRGQWDRVCLFLLKEIGILDFKFYQDIFKVTVHIGGILLGDTGYGSCWTIKSWTNDKCYNGLRYDIEHPNPSFIITD